MQPTGEFLSQPGGLAERLFVMRKTAGLTGARMAADLGWPRSKVSKLETGRQMPKPDDIRKWAAECGQPGAVPDLLDLLATAQAVHRQHKNRGHAALQEDVDKLVRRAKRIRGFEVALIPGLLQTPDYARCRADEIARLSGKPEDDVEDTVATWMRRQEVLYDSAREFEFILTEAALWFHLAPAAAMAAQVDRLLSLFGLRNITLAIIPFGTELPVTPLHGFLMADDVTYLETYASDITLRGEESAPYGPIADALMAEAVTGDEARQLLVSAAARLREST